MACAGAPSGEAGRHLVRPAGETGPVTSPAASLPDTWFTRDLPVLRAIARLVDAPEHGGSPYLLGAVVPASGLPKADVVVAAKALAAGGYI